MGHSSKSEEFLRREKDIIRLERPRQLADGVYIKGKVNNIPVIFTTDTGATRTIVSKRVFDQLVPANRPVLRKTACLIGAGGAPIKEAGQAKLELYLGPVNLIQDVIVADIEDEALLGYDILSGKQGRPADILLSENKIVLDGQEIPVFQIGRTGRARQVIVAEDMTLPPFAEAVVKVFVERFESDDSDLQADYVIEPTENFKERYPLQMASTLVNINQSPTCVIRLLNPFTTEVKLRQDAVIGSAEKIERVVSVLSSKENDKEESNFFAVRRVVTSLPDTVTGGAKFHKPKKVSQVPNHLKSLLERSTKGKTKAEIDAVAALLIKYQNTFSTNEWDLGLTHLTEHPINTGAAAPIKQRPHRVPLAYAAEEKGAIEDLLKKGVIQKSVSPWASPIVLVRKKNGSLRPCVDYRKVNALVKPDGFPLPRIQDCLDAVAGAHLFSSFDLTSGYFQIPLKKEDIPKTSFVCKFGQFEMTRMPFGLNNAASTFQRTMELALQGLQWHTCLVYIDDIIVYGTTFEQHLERVDEVLSRLQNAGLKLKSDKCHMLQTEVVFLGHVVSSEGVKPDPTNVAKIIGWPTPKNPKQVRQFVATGSYYRRFIRDFAKVSKPLVDLTRKDATFEWKEAKENAFNALKQALVSPEVMSYPLNAGGMFYLDVDASGVGIGAVLAQLQVDRERVIAYASRALSRSERNYCITEKELLAVVYYVQYFRQYLLGRRFTVRTDHQALVWLFSMKEPRDKIARWTDILATYDFAIEYRSGLKQPHCDALSRCEGPKDCDCPLVDTSEPLKCGPCTKCRKRAAVMVAQLPGLLDRPHGEVFHEAQSKNLATREPIRAVLRSKPWCSQYTSEQMATMQDVDSDIGIIARAINSGKKPESADMTNQSPETRHYWVIWDQLLLKDGVLFRRRKDDLPAPETLQLITPKVIREAVVRQSHNPVTAGHQGVKKTKAMLVRSFYWFHLKTDIRLYIQACDICERDKTPNKKPTAPMGHLQAGGPWDMLAMDFVGPLPVTPAGNRHILAMTDHFTKYVEVIPVKTQTAEECAEKIVEHFISRWGTPLTIHSDQGSSFESQVFRQMCSLFGIKKSRSSPRNPKGNGQVERFNRSILKMIRAYLADEQTEWDLHLGSLAGAYRATPHESTGQSPNMLATGQEVRLPADVIFGQPDYNAEMVDLAAAHALKLRDRTRRAHELARVFLARKARRNKEIYDSKLSFTQYHVGDAVWFLREARRVGVSQKLEPRFDGPFVVTAMPSKINLTIQLDSDGQQRTIHHDKLKPYRGKNIPSWVLKVQNKLKVKCKNSVN